MNDAERCQLATDTIKDIIDRADAKARTIALESQSRWRRSAAPGTVVPEFSVYDAPDDLGIDELRSLSKSLYEDVMEQVDHFVGIQQRAWTNTVDPGDLATVQATLARKRIPAAELQALYDRFKGTYQLGELIREKAAELHAPIEGASATLDREAADAAASNLLGRYTQKAGVSPAAITASNIASYLYHIDRS